MLMQALLALLVPLTMVLVLTLLQALLVPLALVLVLALLVLLVQTNVLVLALLVLVLALLVLLVQTLVLVSALLLLRVLVRLLLFGMSVTQQTVGEREGGSGENVATAPGCKPVQKRQHLHTIAARRTHDKGKTREEQGPHKCRSLT